MDECRNFRLINMREEFLNFIILWLKQVGILKEILANLGMDAHWVMLPGELWISALAVVSIYGEKYASNRIRGSFPIKITYCNTPNIKCAMN